MTALYIILGIILFVAVILTLRAAVFIKSDGVALSVFAKIGPLKFRLIPSKKKKVKIKKLSRRLRKKKLGNLYKARQSGSAEKEKKKKRPESNFRRMLSESTDGMDSRQLVQFIFELLKAAAAEFDKKLHVTLYRMDIGVDGGDAHSTAILCANLSQAASYLLEILDRHTVLKIKGDGTVRVYPVSCGGVFKCDIFVKIHLSIGSILKSALKLIWIAFNSINFKKQISAIRKEKAK